jgi:hypothetical protein
MQEKECENCHSKNSETSVFCTACGAIFADSNAKLVSPWGLLKKVIRYETSVVLALIVLSDILLYINFSLPVLSIANFVLSIFLILTTFLLIGGVIPGLVLLIQSKSQVGVMKFNRQSIGYLLTFGPIFNVFLAIIAYTILNASASFITVK